MVGVAYQFVHTLALLAVAGLAARAQRGSVAVTAAGVLFTAGIVLFSGSLYALALTGAVPIDGAAPAGGFALMAGWLALIWVAVRG